MTSQKVTGSNDQENPTPDSIFEQCNALWGPFDLDVAATGENALCKTWCGYEIADADGLTCDWHGRCWMNPPYSPKLLMEWTKKACMEVCAGHATLVCALLPAKPEQKWWHWVHWHAQYIQFIQGRVKFKGHTNCAQFPSVIVVWHRRITR